MYCQVIIDIVHENVAHTFTYAIPEGMTLSPGQRVRVPFGPRTMEGVIISLSESSDLQPEKIKPVMAPLEDYPAILPPLMELAKEIAVNTHCPLAETLRLMMPAQMRGGRISVKTEPMVELIVPPEEALAAAETEKRSPKRRSILTLLSERQPQTVRELSDVVREPRDALKQLEKSGLIRVFSEERLRTPGDSLGGGTEEAPPLTGDQREALEEILPTLIRGGGRFLLHGVTGSGKTEVFMAAVSRTLALGRSAIILVPEIALTPQMVAWFRRRFGSTAAVIHSRLSAGERYDEWRRIRRGDARVVIGARSAVFSPTEKLGLIVVDEEHEHTYLSDRHPRYDAREVAWSRCQREGASLILASATPSILSFARARRGDYMLLEMPGRVNRRPLPSVEVADMRRELEEGNRTVLSRKLQQALVDCMAEGQQAMLLMNRRGYQTFVSCRSCGYVVRCPHCDISMTYHLKGDTGKLRCHYCGAEADPPAKCPACSSAYIRYFGAGTQKVEEEVHKLLPGTPTVRMDMDTTGGKDGHARILEEFRSGRARVMVGTQMIAKGLDFPGVTLVGVVAADQTLNLPDYRSRERTFQLLTQVAGRAGRGQVPGKVIIQTYKPEDSVIQYAATQDYRAFFEEEFRRRREALYPPFTVMARLLMEAEYEERALEGERQAAAEVKRLQEAHPEWARKTLLISREAPAIRYLRGKHRRQMLFKLLVGPETEAFCRELTALAERGCPDCDIWFEYNPTNMF